MKTTLNACALFLGVLLSSSAMEACSSTDNPGELWTIFGHQTEGEKARATLWVYADSDTFVFQSGLTGRMSQKKPLPADVSLQMRNVLTGDLMRHYRELGDNTERCFSQGYVLDGAAMDRGASAIACWIPAEVTDPLVRTMLDVMIPIFDRLSHEAE